MEVLFGENFGEKVETDIRSVCYTGLRDEFIVSDDSYNLTYLMERGVACKVKEGQKILVVLHSYNCDDYQKKEWGEFFYIVRVKLRSGKIVLSGITLSGESFYVTLDSDNYFLKIIHIKETI